MHKYTSIGAHTHKAHNGIQWIIIIVIICHRMEYWEQRRNTHRNLYNQIKRKQIKKTKTYERMTISDEKSVWIKRKTDIRLLRHGIKAPKQNDKKSKISLHVSNQVLTLYLNFTLILATHKMLQPIQIGPEEWGPKLIPNFVMGIVLLRKLNFSWFNISILKSDLFEFVLCYNAHSHSHSNSHLLMCVSAAH